MPGRLVISLDFELMWGVRDHRTIRDYGHAVLGARQAIPLMLQLFEQHGIKATWATVGLLFAESREQMLEFAPLASLPAYHDCTLSPYGAINKSHTCSTRQPEKTSATQASDDEYIGKNEKDDPFHYGLSLIRKIAETPGQEIATHTYSHYYCGAKGADTKTFQTDLQAALDIAKFNNLKIQSIIFPRNQISSPFVNICAKAGLKTYRGNPGAYAYRDFDEIKKSQAVRAYRLADSVIAIDSLQRLTSSSHSPIQRPLIDDDIRPDNAMTRNIMNVPSSRFLRFTNNDHRYLTALHLRRVCKELTAAAIQGGTYHLWWHPHNFGSDPDASLNSLDTILRTYRKLADSYGMASTAMCEFAQDSAAANTVERENSGIAVA